MTRNWKALVAFGFAGVVAIGASSGEVVSWAASNRTTAPAPPHARGEAAAGRLVAGVAVTSPVGFRIAGSVHGLYPGAVRSLQLNLVNLLATPIVVNSVKTTVAHLTVGCPLPSLHVAAFVGHAAIKAHGAVKVKVSASMAKSAPNGCQGATFTLRYVGLGTAS